MIIQEEITLEYLAGQTTIQISAPEVVEYLTSREVDAQIAVENATVEVAKTTRIRFTGATVTYDSVTGKVTVAVTGGGSAWGGITGTLSNQTDLWDALIAKAEQSLVTAGFANVATELDAKIDENTIGVAGGVVPLNPSTKIDAVYLPSYVDDVLEYANLAAFPVTGESGKIYIALDTNLTYRWTGSVYGVLDPSLALGETNLTAYRGDRGKSAYDHSQLTTGNPHGTTKADVGLGNVPNTDATLRSNHSGTQIAATISDFNTAVDARVENSLYLLRFN